MNTLTDQIDACLPQTQCTLCGYPDCRSYAKALATQADDNLGRCVPGQQTALKQISQTLQQASTPFTAQVEQQNKPPVRAQILSEHCIGCMKCVHACPIDAIIGSSKKLHAIIGDECTGCELCIPPCPVDCITLTPEPNNQPSPLYQQAPHRRLRYQQRQLRKTQQKQQQHQAHQTAKTGFKKTQNTQQARQALIQAALKRAKSKTA